MCLFPHTMLPYIRSMEVFFDLFLPKSWADLSDPQLLFFFRQLATDKPKVIKIKSKLEATFSKKKLLSLPLTNNNLYG